MIRNVISLLFNKNGNPEDVLDATEKVSEYATLAILLGIIIEIGQPLYREKIPDYEVYFSVIANVIIALGLLAEFLCIGASSRASSSLKIESDNRVAAANLRASEADQKAIEANAEIARLSWALEQERDRSRPRSLTQDQIEAIISNIKGKLDKITFVVQTGFEPQNYMFQLSGVFGQAGCQTSLVTMPAGSYTYFPGGVGMYMPGGSTNEAQMTDDPLYNALKAANLFGGFSAQPFADLHNISFSQLLDQGEHIIYIGQKNNL